MPSYELGSAPDVPWQQPTPQRFLIVQNAGRSRMRVHLRPHDLLDKRRQLAVFSYVLRQALPDPMLDERPQFVAAMLGPPPLQFPRRFQKASVGVDRLIQRLDADTPMCLGGDDRDVPPSRLPVGSPASSAAPPSAGLRPLDPPY